MQLVSGAAGTALAAGVVSLSTWEDSEAQKREWDKEVGEAYMNEMLEDCPSNGPWDL